MKPHKDGWYWVTTSWAGTQLVDFHDGMVFGPSEPQSGTPMAGWTTEATWEEAMSPRKLRELLQAKANQTQTDDDPLMD